MLVERLFPPESSYYTKWRNSFSKLGEKMDAGGLIQLFIIWTLTVSGIVANMDHTNRFVYWEWSGWMIGLIKLCLVSIVFLIWIHPRKLWIIGTRTLNNTELGTHLGIAIVLLLIGWFNPSSGLGSLSSLVPYLTAFLSGLLVFQFILEFDKTKGVWFNFHWDNKELYLSLSVLSMSIAILIGILFDDPVVSTAGMVALPFAAIALIWPSHVRHLQRARFYPIFIFAMFLCVRAPWFLIPLAVLFFVLRTVNYFRYGIVHPSFGVDFLEET